MRDEPVSVSAVMMTAKGRARRRDSGKCWGHWEVRNHYDWWWIRACTPRSYFASRRTWYAVQALTIVRHQFSRLIQLTLRYQRSQVPAIAHLPDHC
jgi:hypothetical protein